jgi:drug/metabolite transporter (DMT)-like permease
MNLVVDTKGLGSVLYLAVFGTGLAFILWYYLLQRVSAVALSLMTFIEPLVASVLGYLILAENLTGRTLAGGGLILIGVLIVTTKKR